MLPVEGIWRSLTKKFDGTSIEEEQACTGPFTLDGSFEHRIGAGAWMTVAATQVNISQSGAFALSVKNVVDGRESEVKTLSVSSGGRGLCGLIRLLRPLSKGRWLYVSPFLAKGEQGGFKKNCGRLWSLKIL